MTAMRKDVELVIKARNEAEKVIKSLTSAVKQFADSQGELQKESSDTDSVLTRLGIVFSQLDKQLKGFTAGQQISQQMERATQASIRLEKTLAENRAEQSRLGIETGKVAEQNRKNAASTATANVAYKNQQKIVRQVVSDERKLSAALKSSTVERNKLISTQTALKNSLTSQNRRVQEATALVQRFQQQISGTANPSKKLTNALQSANVALTRQKVKLEAITAEYRQTSTSINDIQSNMAQFGHSIDRANSHMNRQKSVLATLETKHKSLKATTANSATELNALNRQSVNLTKTIKGQQGSLDRTAKEMKQLAVASDKAKQGLTALAGQSQKSLGEAFQRQRRAVLVARKEWKDYEQQIRKVAITTAQTGDPTGKLTAKMAELRTQAARTKAEYNAQAIAVHQLSSVLRQSATDTDALRARQERFLAIQSATARKIAQIRSESQKATLATKKMGAAFNQSAAGTRRLSNQLNRLNRTGRANIGILQSLQGRVVALVGAYVGFYSIINVLTKTRNAVRELETAQSRLNIVFDGKKLLVAEELAFIRRQSRRLALDFGVLAQEYSKFAVAVKGTGLAKDARKIFVGFIESARVNKLSTQQLSRAFVAITQIASKGVVGMEELRQQLGDAIAGAVQLFAKSMGYAENEIGDFYKAVQAGNVPAAKLAAFALEMQKMAAPQLGKALATNTAIIDKFFVVVQDAWRRFGTQGVDDALARLGKRVTKVLDSNKFIAFSQKLSDAFSKLLDITGTLVENIDKVATAMVALGAVITTVFLVQIGKVVVTTISLLARVGTAVVALKAIIIPALTVVVGLFGPWGIAIAAVVVAIAGAIAYFSGAISKVGKYFSQAISKVGEYLNLFSSEMDTATKAFYDNKKAVDKLKNAYDQSSDKFKTFRKLVDGSGLTLTEINGLLENTRKGMKQLKATINDLKLPPGLENIRKQFLSNKISAGEFLEQITKIEKDAPDSFNGMIPVLVKTIKKFSELEKQITILKNGQTALTDETKRAETAYRKLADTSAAESLDLIDKGIVKIGRSTITLTENVNKLIKQLKELDDADLRKFEDKIKGMQKKFQSASKQALALALGIKAAKDFDKGAGQVFQDTEGRNVSPLINYENAVNKPPDESEIKKFNATLVGLGRILKGRVTGKIISSELGGFDVVIKLDGKPLSKEAIAAVIREGAGQGLSSIAASGEKGQFRVGQGTGAPTQALAEGLEIYKNNIAARKSEGEEAKKQREKQKKAAREAFDTLKKNLELRKEAIDTVEEIIEKNQHELAVLGKTALQQKIIKNLQEAENTLQKQGLELTDNRREAIVQTTTALHNAQVVQSLETAAVKAAKQEQEQINAIIYQRTQLQQQLATLQLTPNVNAGQITSVRQELEGLEQTLLRLSAEKATREIDILNQKLQAMQTQLSNLKQAPEEDFEAIGNVREQIKIVSEALGEATAKAVEMWTAIGGPQAEAAVLKLQNIAISAQNVGNQGTLAKVQWESLDQFFADKLAGAFDAFAQSVAKGVNIFKSARTAFLQFAADFLLQIGKMIIQQAILNALKAAFGGTGGGFGSVIKNIFFPTGHTGGLVGSQRIGSGNQIRAVNPIVFANAQRFHNGGLPGLKPNEVAAILKKNEEVLSTNDPRNVLNGGANPQSAAKNQKQTIKIVNAIDSGSFISAGLDTPEGEEAILNFMRNNANSIKSVMAG